MADKRFQLMVQKGPHPGEIYPLIAPSLTIGRDPMCDIIFKDPEVSRQHIRLMKTENGYQVQDLGSTNGTFVNGRRLTGEPFNLIANQEVLLGSGVTLTYQEINLDVLAQLADNSSPEATAVATPDQPLPDTSDLSPKTADDPLMDESPSHADARQELAQLVAEVPPKPVDEWPPLPEIVPPPVKISPTVSTPILSADSLEDKNTVNKPFEPSSRPSVRPQAENITPAPPPNNNRRLWSMVLGALVLLSCCCCLFTLFMYQWGGDWLLKQMGLLQ